MTALMDFGLLPPEINSGRIYSGPGSAPLLTAAAAWSGLAADLRSTAAEYGSVISGLTTEGWQGPASASMAGAAASYAAWINTTAAQAEKTAAQATAAAGAYQTAFSMTVPPPMIAANRAQLASLVATNVLGQNTPAIMATEAQYMEMWAQDAAAMYGYAGSSAAASKVTPFAAPQQTTNPTALAGQAVAVTQATGTSAGNTQATLSQLVSTLPTALQGLAAPASTTSSTSATTGLTGLVDQVFGTDTPLGSILNSTLLGTVTSTGSNGLLSVGQTGSFLTSFSSLAQSASGAAGDAAGAAGDAAGAAGGAAGAASGLGSGALGDLGALGGLGGVSAGLGRGASIGSLSVPPTWAPAVPHAGSPVPLMLGETPLAAPHAGMPGVPGMPLAGMADRGTGSGGLTDTRFLVRPPMVPNWAGVG